MLQLLQALELGNLLWEKAAEWEEWRHDKYNSFEAVIDFYLLSYIDRRSQYKTVGVHIFRKLLI